MERRQAVVDGFELDGATLRVSIDLDAEAGFRKATEALLAAKGERLCIDLAKVGYIGSAFFGQLFVIHQRACEAGRRLLVRVPPRLMSIMELLGLQNLIEVEAVPEPA